MLKKIINIRNENKLSQDEFAAILCVSRKTISNWENEKCYPDIETLIMIGDKFDISLDELLKEDEEMIKDMDKKIKTNNIKKIIIIVLSVVLLLMIWLGYKMYLLCYYNNNYSNDVLNNYIYNLDNLTINSNNSLANTKVQELNIYIPEELSSFDSGKYYYVVRMLAINIKKHSSLFPSIINNQVYLKGIDYKKIFEKYDINNPNYLIKYFKINYKTNKNTFLSKNQMELKFLTEYFIVNEINLGGLNSKHYYFEGSLKGHMLEETSNYIIYLYQGDETYEISINKNYYDFDDVIMILESIYFE